MFGVYHIHWPCYSIRFAPKLFHGQDPCLTILFLANFFQSYFLHRRGWGITRKLSRVCELGWGVGGTGEESHLKSEFVLELPWWSSG